jgi:hypothetical protein
MKKKVERDICDIENCENDATGECKECGKDICTSGWGRWGDRGIGMKHTVKVTVNVGNHKFTIKLCPDCCVELYEKYGWPIPRRE